MKDNFNFYKDFISNKNTIDIIFNVLYNSLIILFKFGISYNFMNNLKV